MKNALIIAGLITVLFLTGCSDNKEGSSDTENRLTEVEFELSLGENPNATKADYEGGACATTQELKEYAEAGTLMANITLNGPGQDVNGTLYTVSIFYTAGSNKFLTSPLILAPGTYFISQITVMNNETLLFSGVGESSEYAPFVQRTLPEYFNIGYVVGNNYPTIDIYEKGYIDLYLICVYNDTAEDFGFAKWDYNFTILTCLPFAVNMPDSNGEDMVGSGYIQIQNGTYNKAYNIFHPATSGVHFHDMYYFPQSDGLGKFCYISEVTNGMSNNWYKITLYTTSPQYKSYVRYITYQDMANYRYCDSWNSQFNFMHFDFTTNQVCFFDDILNDSPAPTEQIDIQGSTTLDMVSPYVMTKSAGDDDYSFGFTGVELKDGSIDIPAGYCIRIKRPVQLKKETKTHTYMLMLFGAQGSEIASSAFTTYVYQPGFTGEPIEHPLVHGINPGDTRAYISSFSSMPYPDGTPFNVEIVFNHAISDLKYIQMYCSDILEIDDYKVQDNYIEF